jgi:hypothetical protein
MAGGMRAHFVDTLLARLDGEVACIWITIAVRVEAPPDVEHLRALVIELLRTTPRLRRVWREPEGCWREVELGEAELAGRLELAAGPRSLRAVVDGVIARRIDLSRELGFVVGVHPLLEGGTLLTFQLHHAHGDARSLGLLLRRMFRGEPPPRSPSAARPRMSERAVLRAALAHPRASAGILHPRNLMLAPGRAVSLPRDGDVVGPPRVASASFEIPGGAREHAGLFYAALALTAARWTSASTGLVRLRVPVDLSPWFSFDDPPSNTCITVPLELDVTRLRAARSGAEGLAYVRGELSQLIDRGAIWPALLETLAIARVASRARLRAGAVPGLLAERRTNTLVATYVGSLDEYFAAAPFTIAGAIGHTPTWGANAFTLGGRLVVNTSGFEGFWSEATLARFRDELAAWLVEQGAREVERGP